jgi:signal transduction histidine kinase
VSTLPLGRARVDEALWAALVGQRTFGVAVCDSRGLLVELNATLEAMLGEPHQRVMAPEWPAVYRLFDDQGELLAPEDVPLMQALQGEEVVDRIVSTRPSYDSVRHLRCNGARLFDRRGELAGAVVFVADVTAEVAERLRLESLRDLLVETVNHELRTPVAVVKGHAEFLDDLRECLPAEAHVHVDGLSRGVNRLEAVLSTIRQLTEKSVECQRVTRTQARKARRTSR